MLRRSGRSVALVERSAAYRDRIRGDAVAPWGVSEAARLELLSVLEQDAAAQELPFWDTWETGARKRRDCLPVDDPHRRGVLTFRHHHAQGALLAHATALGVRVMRPVRPTLGENPDGYWTTLAGNTVLRSPLVIIADGAQVRRPCLPGGEVRRDAQTHVVVGAIMQCPEIDEQAVSTARVPRGRVLLFPLSRGIVRAYHMRVAPPGWHPTRERMRRELLADLRVGIPCAARGARIVGPIGTFANESRWPTRICASGIALIGDAAGRTDPSIGQGLALTLRDVRELGDALVGESDREAGLERYESRRQHYFAVQRIVAQVAWRIDEPTGAGQRLREHLAATESVARRRLMRAIRADPLNVPASVATSATLLGGVGDDGDPDDAACLQVRAASSRQHRQPTHTTQGGVQ